MKHPQSRLYRPLNWTFCRLILPALLCTACDKGTENSRKSAGAGFPSSVAEEPPASAKSAPGGGSRWSDLFTRSSKCWREDPSRKLLPDGCHPEYGEDVSGSLLTFLMLLTTQKEAIKDCFSDLPESGHSSSLPPDTARCWDNPEKKCVAVPAGEATKPWEYTLPTDDPIWGRFELKPDAWAYSDVFIKRIYYQRKDGTCTIELQAKADVNQDGVYHTMTRPYTFPVGEDPVANYNPLTMTFSTEYPGGDKFPPEPPIFSNEWFGR